MSIVEVVISIAVIVTVGIASTAVWSSYIKTTRSSGGLAQGGMLTDEAGEALTLLRDQSWKANIAPLTLGSTYYIYWNGTSYSTSTTAVAVQSNYYVKFVLSAVGRDASSNIVASGGTNDPNTLKATLTVVNVNSSTTPIAQSEALLHNVYSN